jgi:hypothetical protein
MMHRTAFGIADERTAIINLAHDIDTPRLANLLTST